MCLIAFDFAPTGRFQLVLAANRDEVFVRATAPAHWWADAPGVFGGRDLVAGGGWLLVARNGRIAALTNYRQGSASAQAEQSSRGELVANFVRPAHPGETIAQHAERVAASARRYAGFTLLLFELGARPGAWWVSNRPEAAAAPIDPGIHAISNAGLDAPWPKATRLRAALVKARDGAQGAQAADNSALMEALTDRSLPADADLPDTGVGVARERLLAPAFVTGDAEFPPLPYGTRSSSVISVRDDGEVAVSERTWIVPGAPTAGHRDRSAFFRLDRAAFVARSAQQAEDLPKQL